MAANPCCASRKEKNVPEDDSEIIRDNDSVLMSLCPNPWWGAPHLGGSRRWDCSPNGTRRQGIEDYSQTLRSNGICLGRSWTGLGPATPFILPDFSLLEKECVSCLPHFVFWKHITCLFHRLADREEFCFR